MADTGSSPSEAPAGNAPTSGAIDASQPVVRGTRVEPSRELCIERMEALVYLQTLIMNDTTAEKKRSKSVKQYAILNGILLETLERLMALDGVHVGASSSPSVDTVSETERTAPVSPSPEPETDHTDAACNTKPVAWTARSNGCYRLSKSTTLSCPVNDVTAPANGDGTPSAPAIAYMLGIDIVHSALRSCGYEAWDATFHPTLISSILQPEKLPSRKMYVFNIEGFQAELQYQIKGNVIDLTVPYNSFKNFSHYKVEEKLMERPAIRENFCLKCRRGWRGEWSIEFHPIVRKV